MATNLYEWINGEGNKAAPSRAEVAAVLIDFSNDYRTSLVKIAGVLNNIIVDFNKLRGDCRKEWALASIDLPETCNLRDKIYEMVNFVNEKFPQDGTPDTGRDEVIEINQQLVNTYVENINMVAEMKQH